jgi:signal transduction histidine kinase/CheY-like chemotaxis protein
MSIFTVQVVTGVNLIINIAVLIFVLDNWGQPRMKYFSCAALMITLYALGCFLETISPTVEAALVAYRIQFCAGPFIGVFIALFGLEYAGKPVRGLSRELPFYIIPLSISILVLIDPRNLAGNFRFVSGEGGGYLDVTQLKIPCYAGVIYTCILLLTGTISIGLHFAKTGKKGRIHNAIFFLLLILPFIFKIVQWIGILRKPDFFFAAWTPMPAVVYWYIMRHRQEEWRILNWNTIMEKMPNAVLAINRDKLVININSTFHEFFPGFVCGSDSNLEDIAGFLKQKINSAFPENLFEEICMDDHNTVQGEFALNKNRRTFSLVRQVIRSGNRTMGYTIIINDISIYRTMINEIVKLKQKAEEGSRTKSEFLATMSHEIRTPLNAIIGFSEILLEQELPKNTIIDLEKIHSSGSVLLGIISDILDISKIETGNLELIPVNYTIPSLINDTVHLNLIRIGSKPIVFELDVDETVPLGFFGDELRVKQILNNLLSNAFKYTTEGKVILQVRWTPAPGRAGSNEAGRQVMLSFRVTDTGQGIKKEDIPKLFLQYHQLNARANRNVEGTGLGLMITKNLAEMMHGSIQVESEYGKGSAFTATVLQDITDPSPIGRETAKNLRQFRFIDSRRRQRRTIARTRMPGGMVLVVDDVQTNLDVARGLLLPYGLSIDGVKSGQEAIDRIRSIVEHSGTSRYDLIFMDHMMPGMDGIDAALRIRSIDSDYTRNVPIIALTANALAGSRETFLENGINDFLAKPIDIQKMDLMLEKWIPREKQIKYSEEAAPEPGFSPADTERIPEIEGVDTRAGLANTGGSLPVYRQILSVYAADALERLPRIRAAAEAGEFAAYTTMVHALKGISRSIGAADLGETAARLEEAGRAGDRAVILEETGVFLSALQTLTDRIAAALDKSAAGETGGTASISAAQAGELKDAILEMDTEKVNRLLTEYLSLPLEKAVKELVAGIEQDVLLFEYESAVAKLEKLLLS